MALKIIWTKRDQKKIGKIAEYLEASFSTKTAKALIQKTFVITEILSEYPQI